MFDSLVNKGEYFSVHYLTEVLPAHLRKQRREAVAFAKAARGAGAREAEAKAKRAETTGLAGLSKSYFTVRADLAGSADRFNAASHLGDSGSGVGVAWRKTLHELHDDVLEALGFQVRPTTLVVDQAHHSYSVQVAHAEPGIVAIECGWATDVDGALDAERAGRLATPVDVPSGEKPLTTGSALASFLLTADDPSIRYVLILAGGVVILADAASWGEGRYLAVSLDAALLRSDGPAGELDLIEELFSARSLRPPAEGGQDPLAVLRKKSGEHAVGVSKELREGLRHSVEIIANEVLERIHDGGASPSDIDEPRALANQLAKESLRYLYRILFLLYAEARPELGILPSDDEDFVAGYGLGRLGDLVLRDLVGPEARSGTHLYESLDLLFKLVDLGHGHQGSRPAADVAPEHASHGAGIRFEPLRSELFDTSAIELIGRIENPLYDPDSDDPTHRCEYIDTTLRNAALYKVLRLLMLTRGRKGKPGGFISYANLGINQLGAVYEGLMSYTGFIKDEEQYEVAKGGDASEGSWLVPASKIDDYDPDHRVKKLNEQTGAMEAIPYPAGTFVYRLAGRDRQTSASYYTPETLTKATVQLALRYRLDQADDAGVAATTPARELLDWRICEPALGSGAFLNEAINQVAEEYLRRRQEELGQRIDPEEYGTELQKVKAYVALHRSYGVDLNATAVELAEVSLWLNVMHPGLRAPWFGLHLRRGNSLIGAGRRYYDGAAAADGSWLRLVPSGQPTAPGPLPASAIYHFLLPTYGWGAVARKTVARSLDEANVLALAKWCRRIRQNPSAKRRGTKAKPKPSQIDRLQGLSRRAEFLWGLVLRRLEISERDISRHIDVWGAEDLDRPAIEADPKERQDILAALRDPGSPYWRLKLVMDVWCALWFWPTCEAALLDGTDPVYPRLAQNADTFAAAGESKAETAVAEVLAGFEGLGLPEPTVKKPAKQRAKPSLFDPLRTVIPLADLTDWLDFAEAVLGRYDVEEGSLSGQHFDTLTQLDHFEADIQGWMGMQEALRLPERFPWLQVVRNIIDDRGFFHWELDFAQVFQAGGFDLQVGNPPWVRPEWKANEVLAEVDPWFMLETKQPVADVAARMATVLDEPSVRTYYLAEFTDNVAVTAFLNAKENYPLHAGQPDFYRGFMSRVWAHASEYGTSGLIHPDTHLEGNAVAELRAAAYRRLRVHASFINGGNWAFEAARSTQFGLHVYGSPGVIRFEQASQLYSASTLVDSLAGLGADKELPGIKFREPGAKKVDWDKRAHPARIVTVDEQQLKIWRDLRGITDRPVEQTPLLYPISTAEDEAMAALARYPRRLGNSVVGRVSSGFHESGAKNDGTIKRALSQPSTWSEVILRGPNLGVATPFFKQPPKTGSHDPQIDLTTVPTDFVPATDYTMACSKESFLQAQDRDAWLDYPLHEELENLSRAELVERFPEEDDLAIRLLGDNDSEPVSDAELGFIVRGLATKRYTEFYRMAWRVMVPDDSVGALFAALIPPGPAHIDAVRSMALRTHRGTALVAGFWASIPVEYYLRVTGRSHLDVSDAKAMPAPDPDHPLAEALLIRTLRLNCLSDAYAPIWAELHQAEWHKDTWAYHWPDLAPLAAVSPEWKYATPLRTEYARRAALVEIDALVAVMLGMSADALVAAYRSRFGILENYESEMYFSSDGRKIAGNWNTFGHNQTKADYEQLLKHLDDEDSVPPPPGFTPPFHPANWEAEMRGAHATFTERLHLAEPASASASEGGTSR